MILCLKDAIASLIFSDFILWLLWGITWHLAFKWEFTICSLSTKQLRMLCCSLSDDLTSNLHQMVWENWHWEQESTLLGYYQPNAVTMIINVFLALWPFVGKLNLIYCQNLIENFSSSVAEVLLIGKDMGPFSKFLQYINEFITFWN